MKIHHSPAYYLFFLVILFIGCQSDPIAERNATPPKADSLDDLPDVESLDKADIKELLARDEPPGRVSWQKPEKVINKIENIESKVVADLGAGFGIFSFRLAQHAKKVIALELDENKIHYMDSVKLMDLKQEYQERLETRLVTPTDSRLRSGEADVILIVNTYVLIKDRINYLKHLREVLPDGGQIIIVDFKRKRIPIRVPYHRKRMELYKIESELSEAGFILVESDDCSLEYQYIVVAEN